MRTSHANSSSNAHTCWTLPTRAKATPPQMRTTTSHRRTHSATSAAMPQPCEATHLEATHHTRGAGSPLLVVHPQAQHCVRKVCIQVVHLGRLEHICSIVRPAGRTDGLHTPTGRTDSRRHADICTLEQKHVPTHRLNAAAVAVMSAMAAAQAPVQAAQTTSALLRQGPPWLGRTAVLRSPSCPQISKVSSSFQHSPATLPMPGSSPGAQTQPATAAG